MSETILEMPVVRRRGHIDLDSVQQDEENLTFEVIWSTGSQSIEVAPFDHPFYEQLSFEEGHVDLARFKSGRAPILDAHGSVGERKAGGPKMEDQVGVILDAWIVEDSATPGESDARCRVKMSRRKTQHMQGLLQDIKDRIAVNVSVGYNVTRYRDITQPEDLLPVRLAIRWEPFELSFVPSGDDFGAHMRSKNPHTTTCILENSTGAETMAKPKTTTKQAAGAGAGEKDTTTDVAAIERKRGIQIRRAVGEAGLDLEFADELIEMEEEGQPITLTRARAHIETRLAEEEPAETQTPAANAGGLSEAQVTETQRQRSLDINEMVRVANLSPDFADKLIGMNNKAGRPLSVAHCRTMVIDKLAEQSKATGGNMNGGHTTQVGDDGWTKARSGMQNALEVRCGVLDDKGEAVVLTQHGRSFVGMRFDRMAEEFFTIGGHADHVRGKNAEEIAAFALNRSRSLGPTHGTTDFTSLLANVANKNLRRGYSGAVSDWKAFCRKSTATDYKPMSRVQLGEYPSLSKVPEGAAYEMGTIGESGESYAIAKYGKRIAFTREAMINDDQSALDRLPSLAGRSAAETESDIIWAIITDNATMGDGVALFDAAHGNVGVGVLGKDGLSAGRVAMRTQTGISDQRIGVAPAFLIVPAALETEAQELTTNLQPVTSGGVNPFSGAFKKVIVEPRLDARSAVEYYMFADPANIDVIEYAYLLGNEGPMIETRDGWEIDGMEMRARHEFGAAALDHRGVYRSTGAA